MIRLIHTTSSLGNINEILMLGRTMSAEDATTNWRNVRVISAFTFVDSLQFSFYMWSFWPYIQKIDPLMSTTFVGFIMAISGVGEALAAPLFGYWANRVGRILPSVYFSIVISFIGNVLYFILGALPTGMVAWAILVSRFLSGAGSGNRGCFRALVAANSMGKDRAKALASSGGAALVGLTIGPAVQVAFNWIGPDGVYVGPFTLSKYTCPALLAIIINFASLIYARIFLDDNLDGDTPAPLKHDDNKDSTSSESELTDPEGAEPTEESVVPKILYRMDIVAVIICMGTRSIRMLVTANMESIGAPFSEIVFGFTHDEALTWNTYAQIATGVLTILIFLLYAFTNYTTWVSERTNCIGAVLGLLIFYAITMPWPFLPGTVDCTNYTGNGTHEWSWCESLHPLSPWIYYVTYVIFYGIALSVLNNSLQALYSRVLGSGRQGTMQGVNQAIGSIARILGPIIMSSTFTVAGPRATWGITLGLLALTIIIWIVAYRRLVPLELRQPKNDDEKTYRGIKRYIHKYLY